MPSSTPSHSHPAAGAFAEPFRVFVGYDSREDIAHSVCRRSLLRRASISVEVIPIVQQDLRAAGLYWRDRRPTESTEFSFTRFLTPYLAGYRGWALFVDCDFLFVADVAELARLADPLRAVLCVHHDYAPKETTKMEGAVQTAYPRKNWSSMVLFNCRHPKNRAALTPPRREPSCTGSCGSTTPTSARCRSSGTSSLATTGSTPPTSPGRRRARYTTRPAGPGSRGTGTASSPSSGSRSATRTRPRRRGRKETQAMVIRPPYRWRPRSWWTHAVGPHCSDPQRHAKSLYLNRPFHSKIHRAMFAEAMRCISFQLFKIVYMVGLSLTSDRLQLYSPYPRAIPFPPLDATISSSS